MEVVNAEVSLLSGLDAIQSGKEERGLIYTPAKAYLICWTVLLAASRLIRILVKADSGCSIQA